ncbi:hypothetical protein [Mycolicibacterium holsaticum]|uniref:hypothetical protein n=1 Tax=Mycolicibacterium holsaticum TaxID=152142 RepID=UPI001C7D6B11|nr:hypothetical protein [Mycolicibacterium holsaticum]MDA4108161.1 hypothetical protein [Mycolicibacterium holsaticum DSM 44478 = JCM 12374]QZA14429.1 hypothetical protein K3U96_10160 [Mycolicibacterium holsaticum DSM 44478 = JCM 12374]UNC08121.1 hypothetical protein H5U41_16670 [Mycolicibacterium holsaticum DSM 44478 = JCM 12374]
MTTTDAETEPAATVVTPDQLDAAILDGLADAEGQAMAWAQLRELLPASTYWQRVESLTRLDVTGRVHVVKVDGRNYVALALTLPAQRPRRRRGVPRTAA